MYVQYVCTVRLYMCIVEVRYSLSLLGMGDNLQSLPYGCHLPYHSHNYLLTSHEKAPERQLL